MINSLMMDFVVNKENHTITVKREFAAELPLVWDAFTKSEILDQWWAPKPWRARTAAMDFKEGGAWHYAMVGPDGEEHFAIATYKKIQHHKSYTGIDAFTDAAGNINKELPQATWEVGFEKKADHTLVSFRILYANLDQLEAILKMGFKEGFTLALGNLDELLAAKK